MNTSSTFDLLETCLRLGRDDSPAAVPALLEQLRSPQWQARYAAAIALGDRRAAVAVPALLDTLAAEDAAPLYAQPADLCNLPAGANGRIELQVPAGTTAETLDAWARRGRIKQAVCWALAAIGPAAAPAALPVLMRYATDQKEDYAVRAAACRALRLLGDRAAGAAVEQATHDGEWCTATEARKALAVFRE